MMHPNESRRGVCNCQQLLSVFLQYLLLLFIIVALQRDRWHCTSLSYKIFLHAKVAYKWVEWMKRVNWITQVEWTCRKLRLWCSICQLLLLLLLLLALCSSQLFNCYSVSFLFGFGKRWPRLLPKYSWLLSTVNHALIEQFSKYFCIYHTYISVSLALLIQVSRVGVLPDSFNIRSLSLYLWSIGNGTRLASSQGQAPPPPLCICWPCVRAKTRW